MRLALLLLLASTTTARADHDVAIATNTPVSWAFGNVGASGFIALAENHAVRVNVASYGNGPGIKGAFAEDLPIYRGRVTDGGVSYVLFPDRFCEGFMIEMGVLVRRRDTVVEDDFDGTGHIETESTTLAGRLMIGWNWTIGDHVFIQLAAGISGGNERGEETSMHETHAIDRITSEGEVILRFGARFDR